MPTDLQSRWITMSGRVEIVPEDDETPEYQRDQFNSLRGQNCFNYLKQLSHENVIIGTLSTGTFKTGKIHLDDFERGILELQPTTSNNFAEEVLNFTVKKSYARPKTSDETSEPSSYPWLTYIPGNTIIFGLKQKKATQEYGKKKKNLKRSTGFFRVKILLLDIQGHTN